VNNHLADVMGPPAGDDWQDMSDKDTCPISKLEAWQIANGQDPFLTNEEAAAYEAERAIKAATKEAVELAERAGRAEFAADFDRYHAGLKFIELQAMVKASGSNLSWEKWVEANVKTVSRATVFRYMAFARKQDEAKAETVTQSHAETVTPEAPKTANAERRRNRPSGRLTSMSIQSPSPHRLTRTRRSLPLRLRMPSSARR
jgi:hypothetical protein